MMHVCHREVFAANKELTQILSNFLSRAVVGYLIFVDFSKKINGSI